ncbi:unnamed protein product, partial [Discosporangium mesarthrocarpum]
MRGAGPSIPPHNVGHTLSAHGLLKTVGLRNTVSIVFKGLCYEETSYGIRDALANIGVPSTVASVPDFAEFDTTGGSHRHHSEHNRQVGGDWRTRYSDVNTLHIVLGAHLFQLLPPAYVIVQMEQLSSPWITGDYIQ